MINRFQSPIWTKAKLEEFLLAVEQRRITGKAIVIRTGPGQETQFDAKGADLDKLHQEILYALFLLDPDNYPNPYTQKNMTVHTVYPCSYGC